MNLYRFVRTGALLAAVLVLILLGLALRFSYEFVDANSQVNHTTEVLSEIRSTRVLLGTPGATALSGPAASIRTSALLDQLGHLAELTKDNPRQQISVRDFRSLFADGNPPGDGARLAPERLTSANVILDRMQGEEIRLLAERTRRQSDATQNASVSMISFCSALLILGLATTWAARREFRRRESAEAILLQEKQELTRHTRELALVSAGSELIQAAQDEYQVNDAVATVLRDLLPESSGYFGLISPSKDLVEVSCSWGDGPVPEAFPPESCVALQLGRQIHRSEALIQVTCAHVQSSADYICMPLRSASGHLGILHVESATPLNRKAANAVNLFASHVALGITNLRMREALRNQTVRDSLTGLFNRRYFDETLQREVAHSRREGKPLSVLMIDVDKFKKCNDTFGHAAGDEALRGFGRIMRSVFRESDVVCRYGGEEFAVIMVDASLQNAYTKAESFRKLIADTELTAAGISIGRMTASIGVACSNEFGPPGDLVHAADSALYHAKRMGRNATWVCSDVAGLLPAVPSPETPDLRPATPPTDTSLTNLFTPQPSKSHYTGYPPIQKPPSRPS